MRFQLKEPSGFVEAQSCINLKKEIAKVFWETGVWMKNKGLIKKVCVSVKFNIASMFKLKRV